MEFRVTKEQILELANWANPDNEEKLKEWFPKAFELQLEVGKWYTLKKHNLNWLMNYQGGEIGYGFNTARIWSKDYNMKCETDWKEATHEEIEPALIAEAKKKGFKVGVRIKGLGNGEICTLPNGEFEYIKNANALWFGNPNDAFEGFDVFLDGKWAEILPEQKTIITKGKALRIIAKKLKVSPESIEIQ